MTTAQKFIDLPPQQAADALYAAHRHDAAWLDAFAQSLDRRRAAASLEFVFGVWDLSQSEAARLFGVSRQAVSKWLVQGAPPDRAVAVADLAAATDLLVHYLKRDRIPAVVRRPIPARDDVSLVDLIAKGDTASVLDICRAMFRFERASGKS